MHGPVPGGNEGGNLWVGIDILIYLFSIRYMVEGYGNMELRLGEDDSSLKGDEVNILGVRNESISISAKGFPRHGTKIYRKPSSLSCLEISVQHRTNKK